MPVAPASLANLQGRLTRDYDLWQLVRDTRCWQYLGSQKSSSPERAVENAVLDALDADHTENWSDLPIYAAPCDLSDSTYVVNARPGHCGYIIRCHVRETEQESLEDWQNDAPDRRITTEEN